MLINRVDHLCETCRQLGNHAEYVRLRLTDLRKPPHKKYKQILIASGEKELAQAALAFFQHQEEAHGKPLPDFIMRYLP